MRSWACTTVFTVISIALCCVHYFGYDPKSMLLFSLSVPLWFLSIFGNVHTLNLFVVYALTIASWMVIGYVCDRFINNVNRSRRRDSYK